MPNQFEEAWLQALRIKAEAEIKCRDELRRQIEAERIVRAEDDSRRMQGEITMRDIQ